ncbi:MAG TPA: DUF1684 domain-containing protein [Ktedonobacterales bacterium]|nr:DUF1684 domain-containing protein [Ktedonobacterales bacterium]
MSPASPTWLDLFDFRERMARIYRERDDALRTGTDPTAALARFRAAKDAIFRAHPQSALPPGARATFTGLRYFPYAPELRVEADLTPLPDTERAEIAAPSSGQHPMPLRPAAQAQFTIADATQTLTVYWIDVYGGGLFLPFRDATSPAESYGAGRYLFDTVKGSTFERLDDTAEIEDANVMGYAGGRIMLDFNYAYNPSCCYDLRWVCPLAPRENWLDVPLRAGEMDYHAI